NAVYTLPFNGGSSGQFLSTDGAGNLSWANTVGGISSLNGQTMASQTFATPGTAGTSPSWSSTSGIHTLNIPMASTASVTAGLVSNADWNAFNSKQAGLGYSPVNKAG